MSDFEFEREVEAALGTCLAVPLDGESYVGFYRRAMDLLRPRVAAAIQQAALLPDCARGSPRSEEPELFRRALAALRGEAPEGTWGDWQRGAAPGAPRTD